MSIPCGCDVCVRERNKCTCNPYKVYGTEFHGQECNLIKQKEKKMTEKRYLVAYGIPGDGIHMAARCGRSPKTLTEARNAAAKVMSEFPTGEALILEIKEVVTTVPVKVEVREFSIEDNEVLQVSNQKSYRQKF